jgi:signal transduction histidine kinase
MKRIKFTLKGKFFIGIVIIVVPVLGLIFAWTGIRNERHATSQVVNQARILARQIVMTRQWVADCGGIMVARNSLGAKGTLYFYDERLSTARGVYQKFTPSMVTKKLSTYSMRENMYQFKLAGINPMNPQNSADPFEKMALHNFIHKGAKEVYSFEGKNKAHGFRYSVPLHVDESCLRCHKDFTEGTIGGCLSISFPVEGFRKSLRKNHYKLALAGVGLIALTICTLFFTLRLVVIKPLNELEHVTSEISNGNLNAKVRLETGDEFERLGHAFNTMGARLTNHRENMEERIKQATHDLSEANRELQQLDKLKTDFIADMSHELRSPVTAIKGGLDYLKRTIHGQEKKNYLALIDNNLLRLTHLVSDMLDLTRIEAGNVEWHYEENDLAVLIREVIEILSLKAKEKSIDLNYTGDTPLWVDMDLERIEQVLVNLIENAIKFSYPNSSIDIDTRIEDRWVSVRVADSGIGIAASDLENIFIKFHSLPSGRGHGHTQGTGLGLTISRKIVDAHGGRIWADSQAGRGSVLTFTLPLRQAHKDDHGAHP